MGFCSLNPALREYSRLKEVYADELVRNWAESSDPEKSVHEDIGIAAYLACLWGNREIDLLDIKTGHYLFSNPPSLTIISLTPSTSVPFLLPSNNG